MALNSKVPDFTEPFQRMAVCAGECQHELFSIGNSLRMAVLQAEDRDQRRVTDDNRQRNAVAKSGVRLREPEKEAEMKGSGKSLDEKLAYRNFQEWQAIVDLRCIQETFLQPYRMKNQMGLSIYRSTKLDLH